MNYRIPEYKQVMLNKLVFHKFSWNIWFLYWNSDTLPQSYCFRNYRWAADIWTKRIILLNIWIHYNIFQMHFHWSILVKHLWNQKTLVYFIFSCYSLRFGSEAGEFFLCIELDIIFSSENQTCSHFILIFERTVITGHLFEFPVLYEGHRSTEPTFSLFICIKDWLNIWLNIYTMFKFWPFLPEIVQTKMSVGNTRKSINTHPGSL